jgi:hypothetical protein
VFGRLKRLVACLQRSFLVEVGTFCCLNKYFFKKRKYNNIPEKDALKIYIYAIENGDCASLL